MEEETASHQPPALPQAPLRSEDERLYATLLHLSALSWFSGEACLAPPPISAEGVSSPPAELDEGRERRE